MKTTLTILSLFLTAGTLHAQAFIEHLSPPVVRRGQLNQVVVIGTETASAIGGWSSVPAEPGKPHGVIGIRAKESNATQAVLDLDVPANAPLGIYGLRLATRSGLSNVHLFAIDELPIMPRETDLAADGVQPVTLPVAVTSIAKAATIDRYSISVAKDQRIAFEVVGNRLGKDYDPLVQIRSSSGKLIAEHDNSVGLMFDCRFAHTFVEAGTYTVEIRDARFEGHPTWHYILRMGDFPEARTAVPSSIRSEEATSLSFPQIAGWRISVTPPRSANMTDLFHEIRMAPDRAATWIPLTVTDLPSAMEVEPNDTRETATTVSVPATLNGVLDHPGDSDWFAFELVKDQKLNVQGVTRRIGSAADLELILYDADGREVRRVDDTDQDEGGFAYNVGKPGVHRLQVRETARGGGSDFTYRIDVRVGGPSIQLFAEAPDITLPRGNYQSFPFKVIRTDYNGEIRLELRGAPAGVTLDPAVIPADTNEFVARLIADANAAEGISSIQVMGTATLKSGETISATAKTKPLVDRQLKNVDLIPYALREDQRSLPPSLQDRIALMVVPAAPFNVELPEPTLALTRFQTADLSIVTTREAGFSAPITFTVKGGQLGNEEEERNQVYARFVSATPDRLTTQGTFFNRINTQLTKHRVDFTATSIVDGRTINLTRAFTMDIRSAFRPTYEPEIPKALPGETVRVKLVANRVPTFEGPLQFTLGPSSGFIFPAMIEIPAGQPSVEFEVKVDPKLNAGRHGIRVEVAGFVGKYEESFNVNNLQIDVQKPPQ